MTDWWHSDPIATDAPTEGDRWWEKDKIVDEPGVAVPQPFLARVQTGQAMSRILSKASEGAKEGYGDASPTGLSDETLNQLIDLGIFHDPARGRPGPIQFANETMILPTAKALDTVMRSVSAGIHGAAGAFGQLVDEFGGEGKQAEREAINFGNWAMIEAGFGRFSRPHVAGERTVIDQHVGNLPRDADFQVGAKVLGSDAAEENLRTLWEERGIHPAEAVHDAQTDAFLKSDLTAPATEPADRSGIAPVRNSPIPEGTPRTELAKTGEPQIDTILDSPVTKRNIDNPVIDDTHDVPYSAGGSVPLEDPTMFIDRHFPRSMTIDGVTFDPAEPFTVHENLEQHIMDLLIKGGMKDEEAYRVAHFEYAEKAEGAWYRAHGIDQAKAEAAYEPFIEQIQHENPENPPPNLYTKPYPHANVRGAKQESVEEAKPSKEEIAQARAILDSQGAAETIGAPLRSAGAAVTDIKEIIAQGVREKKSDADIAALTNGRLTPADVRVVRTSNSFKEYLKSRPVSTTKSSMDLNNLRPAYEQIKTEQNGIGTVWIGDLIELSGLSKEAVHAALIDAAKRGEVSLNKPSPAWTSISKARQDGSIPNPNPDENLPLSTVTFLRAAEAPPRSLGAAATGPLPDLTQQPAQPPGRLMAAIKDTGTKLFDIGRDIQRLVSPMTMGTRDSMAMAKDFANLLRRNRWDWSRIDSDVAKRFTLEQRKRMWDAADEESVAIQLGESREHQGLVTLEPSERLTVEVLQARSQNAWLRAVDLGMVEGEGLPAYTPRMVINLATGGKGPLNRLPSPIGRNLRTTTEQLLQRKYMTAEETEAAAQRLGGEEVKIARDIRALPLATAQLEDAIAGRTLINGIKDYGERTGTETVAEGFKPDKTWFTIDHPAFRKTVVFTDETGNKSFRQVPIYVHGDFEGPLRAVLSQTSGAVYGALMGLKGKTMSLIMNSPLIHNAVEWGRALPAMPGKVATFKVYFDGNRAKNNPGVMREAIDAGLVPIGKRFFNQDINAIMEEPNLTPGRSWTAQVLGFVPGLFDEGAGNAVKAAIDKAGDFWHNTLLWDRVGDLQMGLYSNFQAELMAKGVDRLTASRAAAHWANRYAGALPQEAMSDGARKIANLLLFSRSFTLGNLGAMKDMLTGLPKDVMAQIERDGGFAPGAIERAEPGAPGNVAAFAKSMARRKAMAIVALDIGLMYVGNSLLQNAMNVLLGDSTLDNEMHGYAQRFSNALTNVGEHPLKLLQPLDFLGRLSATEENEPGRQDRIKVGFTKDGTAIYARNPAGKIGEEFIGYLSGPLDMIRRKLGTIARPAWQILANDKGFGHRVYDPNADTPAKYLTNLGKIVAHLVQSQFPTGQMSAASDLVKGEGDPKLNALQAFGPVAGVTFSRGAPGGPAIGEFYNARSQHQYAVDAAIPDIRRQIQRGDIAGAQQRMTELGIPAGLQRWYIRTAIDPKTRLSPKTLRDFYEYATPEQKQRLERAR